MGKASSAKKQRVVAPDRKGAGRSTALPWIISTVVVVVLGVIVIVISRGDDADEIGPVANRDHWHAALGVNVCGTWAPNPPEFELQAGSGTLRAGVHSHGDGLIHIHPFSSSEGGNNATVGRFFEYGGWDLDAEGFSIWTGEQYRNGDTCPGGQPGRLVWEVNGEPMEGNPADYKPSDLDVIAIGFLPEGEELGEPPSAAQVASPEDLPQEFPTETGAPTTGGAATTSPATTPTTGGTATTGATTPTTGGTATTAASPTS